MNNSSDEVHEGTKTLQELADEVERERQQRGRSRLDTEDHPKDEAASGDDVSGDPVPVADQDVDSPNATVYGRIQQQNSPS
jgi:hypothetical protein